MALVPTSQKDLHYPVELAELEPEAQDNPSLHVLHAPAQPQLLPAPKTPVISCAKLWKLPTAPPATFLQLLRLPTKLKQQHRILLLLLLCKPKARLKYNKQR